ncbi:hypothetical protein OD799_23535, partial [Pseudomonas aeruginosa]|uniref:hypothetical protein n=1 Tax=Pseudomonas aeruginosa TaxID=287 RepID=UPI0021F1D457
MHTLYWRDLESPANGEWLGLAVQVEGGAPGRGGGGGGGAGPPPPRPRAGGGGGRGGAPRRGG